MRVSSDSTLVDLAPGSSADVVLDVINTGLVIDGVTARVVGLPERQVSTTPPVLALFPEATGRMTVSMGLPSAFPAGRHPVTVEVHSRQVDAGPEYLDQFLDLDLVVPPQAAFGLFARPEVARAHRTARFVVTVTNEGNVPLDVALSATDDENALATVFDPGRLTVEPRRARDVLLEIRGPRLLLGSEIDRPATVTATATRSGDTATGSPDAVGTDPTRFDASGEERRDTEGREVAGPVLDLVEDDQDGGTPAAQTITVTLRQRPWLTRGLLTALILLAIIGLWAALFLFGLRTVFAQDPATKTAPASFFVATVALAGSTQDAQAMPSTGAATAASPDAPPAVGAAAPPAGPPPPRALAKDGAMPPGLGGTIVGTVRAASSGEPVGRILVEALRKDSTGNLQMQSSAATQADGSYQVAGLFPTQYVLRFSANGFTPVYIPSAADQSGATQVSATVGEVTAGIDVVITGMPASIEGSVDLGDTLQPLVTTITVRATQGPTAGQDVVTTTTDAANAYSIATLPAPATYELSLTTPGYQPSIVTTSVDGGATRLQPTVLLSAGNGSISGTITDGTTPLGGITIATTVNKTAVSTGTPTTGQVGQFVLGDLPTPATYVLTVSGPGYGQSTVVVDLGPGEQKPDLAVTLSSGTGTLTGQLVDATGAGLGGATIRVGGMANPPTTNTLTDGAVGAFSLSGLPSGGALTLTFTHPGFADTTVPVPPGNAAPLTVTMAGSQGWISGTVTGSTGAPIPAATVTATDGQRTWPVAAAGGYVITGLPAGPFTVTAKVGDGPSQTALVTVTAGAQATVDFVLPDGG